MRMKFSLARGPSGTIDGERAWGCLTANLAIPGAGSLVAGRAVGYAQLAGAVSGVLLTGIFGLRFFAWFISNWAEMQTGDDPIALLEQLWLAVRWALLGIALFAGSWLWALATGMCIVRTARRAAARRVPPKL